MFARSITLAIAALALGSSANAQCTRNATVVAGNTCDIISQENSVSTYQLALVNNGTVNAGCTNLYVDQELCLGWNGMDCTETHMVIPGDTCDGISSTYNLTANQIYANNPQIDVATCNNLYVGEVVCVAQKTYAYPLLQLPSSSPNNAGQASPTPESAITATASATVTAAPSATPTDASEECEDENSDEVEYCDEDDTSADCVDEDDLPYCDEQ